jgi:C1A family cysteine protease
MSIIPKRKYNLHIQKIKTEHLKLMKLPPLPKLPVFTDLRVKMPPIYNQGDLGSCTANALCAVIGCDSPEIIGSRLFLYYNERKLENDIPDDVGATLSDGIKCLQIYGICQETLWTYDISKFAVKPSDACYTQSGLHKVLKANNIQNDLISMKTSLANGLPFVVGIMIYESFESDKVTSSGIVPMPNIETEQLFGGHAVVCVGYNDTKQMWLMRNSWGTEWGLNGYFYLPYEYLIGDLATDLWNISSIQK